ncbi:LOW QUALITY PROTEIN: cAMP-dependent protein kinase type II regulatory subunit-like [Gigantopelta aegis]|uniref:LOW QUALITY PROTEIN: cAMP-dependent protein kinase type II regulatory subunit-like n=1 Tax=Gigantopelta aegis TaxID=1735272 RepID=UPI001B887930|nr:LOW QUALITY PROTEIN: cAMP-dependent protein kinase type II regulatory subunit-like [Gigantopelta aegis]
MDYEMPVGLGKLLSDFTVAVLRDRRRGNLYDFAVSYFTKARDMRQPKKVPMYIIVDDEEAGEPDPDRVKLKTQKTNRYARRTSVSGERYDPEADDDDDDVKIVNPKSDVQKRRLADAIGGILLFRSLESDQVNDVINAMFEKRVQSDEIVMKQGDNGENVYVVDSGTYVVSINVSGKTKVIHTFVNSGCFGELALMYNMPRSATITAVDSGLLWAMDRHSFRRIVLKAAFKKRKMYESFLEQVPILKSLDRYERMNLADALVTRHFADSEVIIKQNDEADGVYFVEQGTVQISITRRNGNTEPIGTLKTGKYFGELALITKKRRSANVNALGDVKVAFLGRESFERILGCCVDIMKRNTDVYKMFAPK